MICFKYSSQQIFECGDLCHSSGICLKTSGDSHLICMMQAAGILRTREGSRLKAMAADAFFEFLHSSELRVTDAEHYLRVKDVRFSDLNLLHCRLKLCSSKHSQRSTIVNLYDFPKEEVQLVRLLRKYIVIGQVGQRSPLFAITASHFGKMLAEITQEARIKRKISPHCFRHGGASWANENGWSTSKIKSHGRWKSSAYESYITTL